MARVFTTEFLFNSYWFRGLVIIKDEKDGLIIRLRVFDNESIRILGKDSIEFVGLTGYKNLAEVQTAEAQELLDVLYRSILDYLTK